MAGFAIMLEYAGATNNWSTYFRPIIACPGILSLILTLLWDRQTKQAAILAPVLGLISGVATWLSLSWKWSGAINITTTQVQLPGLYGAIVSFFSPALYSVIISLIWPSRFDWREFLRIDLIEDKSQPSSSLPSAFPSKEAVNETVKSGSDSEKGSLQSGGETRPIPNSQSNARILIEQMVQNRQHLLCCQRPGYHRSLAAAPVPRLRLYAHLLLWMDFYGSYLAFRSHVCRYRVPCLRWAA